MKYVLEFGVRGGQFRENTILHSRRLACQMAADLARVFLDANRGDTPGTSSAEWLERLRKNAPRVCWTSHTHFVAVSRLDGVGRGPAASKLWPHNPHNPETSIWCEQ